MRKNNKFSQWVGLSCLWLSLFISTTAFSAEEIEYRFERMWPQLEQPWYFNQPTDIAIAPDGSVYVVDTKNHRVQQFSSEGEFIRKWGEKGKENGQFDSPEGVAVASDGTVYIVDTGNQRIQQFSAEGNFIRTWDGSDSSDGKFFRPTRIAVTGDNSVYVIDTHIVQQFNANGGFVRVLGRQASTDGTFLHLADLAAAPDGGLYVLDYRRVQKFNVAGSVVQSWGRFGSDDGELSSPSSIDIGLDGSVYVAGSVGFKDRIQKFNAEGGFIRKWIDDTPTTRLGVNGVTGVAVASDGSFFVAVPDNNKILKFNREGSIQSWGSSGLENGKFEQPRALSIAPNGDIYVADYRNDRIQQFSSEGDFIKAWGEHGSKNGQFFWPSDIAIAPDGSVYILDNNHIQQFSAQGAFIRVFKKNESAQSFYYRGLAIAPSGDVYVTVTDNKNHRVQQFSTNGDLIREWGSEGDGNGQFFYPEKIAIAPDGNIYVADSRRVQKFSAEGHFIWAWNRSKMGDGKSGRPRGLSVSSDGNIYVVDSTNHNIQQLSPEGQFIQSLGGRTGSQSGQFKTPYDLDIAADGRIYVADMDNNRIQQFAPRAKTHIVATTPEAVTITHPYKAIILAGGGKTFSNGRTNSIWDGTWRITNKAYKALSNQAFKIHDEIKFLTAGSTQFDLDQNNKFDDLEVATKESLRLAITSWASDAADVVIYLSNHGGPGKFKINSTEILTSDELDTWVSQLENKIPGKVTVVIEACNSASFFPQLTRPGRYLFASAKADQSAVIANDGLTSFSYTFWSEVSTGAVVKTAFKDARQSMSRIVYGNEAQNSQAETDGNGTFNQQDLDQLGEYCLGECNQTAGAAPEVKPFSVASQSLHGDKVLEFSVNVDALQPLSTVWAIVQRPDDISIDSNQPLAFQKINLSCDQQNQCQGRYENFDLQGEYRLSVYAKDTQGEVSFPETLTVMQTQGNAVYPVQYDENLSTVYLRDVEYQGQHYQVALEQKGGKFVLIAASLAPKVFSPAAKFDASTNLLTVPHALVLGQPYQARFKHLGNFEFELESAAAK